MSVYNVHAMYTLSHVEKLGILTESVEIALSSPPPQSKGPPHHSKLVCVDRLHFKSCGALTTVSQVKLAGDVLMLGEFNGFLKCHDMPSSTSVVFNASWEAAFGA